MMLNGSKAGFTVVILALTACGGGGGGGGGNTIPTGVFYDSPVTGLQYSSDSYSGLTDAKGSFKYRDGETTVFSIGDIVLGETQGHGFVTPMHLAGVTDPNHDTVVNLSRFLQTLDDDGDPDAAGISITQVVRELAVGQSVNFTQTAADFGLDPDVQSLIATLTDATSAGIRTMVDGTQAVSHLTQTLTDLLSRGVGSYKGSYGVERTNCTDGNDAAHSFMVASGTLSLSSVSMSNDTALFSGSASFIEYNFDIVNDYRFVFDDLAVDLLGNLSGITTHTVDEGGLLRGPVDVSFFGQWDSKTLIIRFPTRRTGVNEAGSVSCDSGGIIRVKR